MATKTTPYVTEGKNEVHFLICQGNFKFSAQLIRPHHLHSWVLL